MVVAAPAATARLLHRGVTLGEFLFGSLAGPEDVGELPAGLLPFFAPVGRDGGV